MKKETNNIGSIEIKGPSLGYTSVFEKREIWTKIAKEENGQFKIKHNSGCELETHNITIPYKKWKIEISVSDTKPLKFKIVFDYLIHFDLNLSWEDFIERIMKKFGKTEIEIGFSDFDNKYLINSNRSDLVHKILTRDIQNTLLKHDVYSLSYISDKKNNSSQLISTIQRQAGDKDLMIELITLFKTIIDNLEHARVIK